jgi:hypothetical protein
MKKYYSFTNPFLSLGYSQTKTEIFKKKLASHLTKRFCCTSLKNSKKETLVILIAGPTDRNGNQRM